MTPAAPEQAGRRWSEYMRLDTIEPAIRNPKDHDEQLIGESVGRFGFMEAPFLDERTGKLVAGHGRTDDLRKRQAAGEAPPGGVELDADGEWCVNVQRGWASRNDDEAHAAGIALNRVGERGGWKADELYEMLDGFAASDDGLLGLGFDGDDLDDLVASMQEGDISFDPEKSYSHEGAHAELDVNERAALYATKGIRSLVLDYKLDDFDVLAASLARVRRARGVTTNAETVAALVAEAVAKLPT